MPLAPAPLRGILSPSKKDGAPVTPGRVIGGTGHVVIAPIASSTQNIHEHSSTTSVSIIGDKIQQQQQQGPSSEEALETALHSIQYTNGGKLRLKHGRIEALNVIRAIDQVDTKLFPPKQKEEEKEYNPLLSRLVVPTSLQPMKNIKMEKPPSKPTSPKKELTIDSTTSDFKDVQRDFLHPAVVLNVVPDQRDRELFTEYDKICNEVLASLSELEMAIEDMAVWKDDFLKQSAPSNVKLQMTLIFARVFRSKSDLHEPLFELLKQVRMYSRPWNEKKFAILELEQDFHRQQHVIDVAIKKLETLQSHIHKLKSDKRVALWEKVAKKLLSKAVLAQKGNNVSTPHETVDMAQLFKVKQNSSVSFAEDKLKQPPTKSSKENVIQAVSQPNPQGSKEQASPPQGSHLARKQFILDHSTFGSQKSLKSDIRDYIATEDPSWKKSMRDYVRRFTRLLYKLHPGVTDRLRKAHLTPFVQPKDQLEYISLSNASLTLPIHPPKITRNPWSLLDLNKFHRHENQYVFSFQEEVSKEEDVGKRLARCNSFNAIYQLQGAQQRAPFPEYVRRFGIKTGTKKKGANPFRARRPSYVEDEASSCSEYEEVDEEDDFQYQEFLTDADQTTIQQAVKNFFGSQEDSSDNPQGSTESISKEVAAAKKNKMTFNLQEIMELTLTHAQQMQLLSNEYEKTITGMTHKMNTLEKEKNDILVDYEQRLRTAQERAQRLAKEYMSKKKEDMHNMDDHMFHLSDPKEGPLGNQAMMDDRFMMMNEEHGFRRYKRAVRYMKGVKKHQPKAKKPPMLRYKARQASKKPRKKPEFSSEPFKLKFLERLNWFTHMKLKNKKALKERLTSLEMQSIERKLVQAGLIRDEHGEWHSPKGKSSCMHKLRVEFAAEFMPAPGRVQTPKHKEMWQDHGVSPWGGKFTITRKEKEQVNILNLFEVMTLMEKNTNKK